MITEASTSSDLKFGKEDVKKLNVFNVESGGKTLKYRRYKFADSKDVQDNSENKRTILNSGKQKLVRVPLEWNPRNREHRFIDTADKTVNENEQNGYRSKFYENATPSNKKSSQATGAPKNDKKLKLTQIQTDSDNQDFGKYMMKRANYFVNEEKSVDDKNQINTRDDYYAQRKLIMDKFDSRQREITDKYRNERIAIPNNVFRYNLSKQMENNNKPSLAEIERENIYKGMRVVNNNNNRQIYSNREIHKHTQKKRMENNGTSENTQNMDDYEYYDENDDQNEDEVPDSTVKFVENSAGLVDNRTVLSHDTKPPVVSSMTNFQEIFLYLPLSSVIKTPLVEKKNLTEIRKMKVLLHK